VLQLRWRADIAGEFMKFTAMSPEVET